MRITSPQLSIHFVFLVNPYGVMLIALGSLVKTLYKHGLDQD